MTKLKLEDIGFLEVIEDRAKNIKEDKISYCEWFITSSCNFGCPYCNRLEPRKIPDPSLSDVRRIVSILKSMDCKYIHLTGGEPTTRSDLIDIIHIIKDYGIRVGLSTNGSKPITYYVDLVDAGVELFSISLDVHQRNLNKKFTMVDDIFDTVVDNISELSKLVYVNVGVVFNDNNINSYQEILRFISNLGVADIRIMTSTKYNKVIIFDIDKEILSKHPILKYRVENFNAGKNMRGSDLSETSKCHLVRDDITIFGNEFYPCAVYAREKGKPIGIFDYDNIEKRLDWFSKHNSHIDHICRCFCMDFKCMFNERVEQYESDNNDSSAT